MENNILLEDLLQRMSDDDFIELWDCAKRETFYEGYRGGVGRFLKEHNCRPYLWYNVVALESFIRGDHLGLSISIDERR